MQEEVESRTVSLIIRASELTGDVLRSALGRYLDYRKGKKRENAFVKPRGKQTVKELVGQNQGVSSMEITEGNIKGFERYARKYGVDYAVKKDVTGETPKFIVFFKARDADALTAAFLEYSRSGRKNEKPSVIDRLRSLSKREVTRERSGVRNKDKELSL